jgi:hypothetical protein
MVLAIWVASPTVADQIKVEELLSDMVTSFPGPAFFIGPDKPGDAFQALDNLTGGGQIGFELGDPALDLLQAGLASA